MTTVETNPTKLSIELFCHGLRLDESTQRDLTARGVHRTRAGLGSGLELVVPGKHKDHWINVPVLEPFAKDSPYRLATPSAGRHVVVDERTGDEHRVRIPADPAWYDRKTSSGRPMSEIGVLQGTYLGIYVGKICSFWAGKAEAACQFCTTGLNVGGEEEALEKTVEDVVETALAAKQESGITFVHMNTGYHGETTLDVMKPFVKALKERVGVLVGVQASPVRELSRYDELKALGVDHLSFCYEFHDPEVFARYCPGKAKALGQETYFNAIEYCSKLFGRGTCSGEIIAGIEPLETTLEAIEWITSKGAFPTVCIFRPTIGSRMQDLPSPSPDDMEVVMRAVWDACRKHLVPVGLAPNIEVSLIVNPLDARELIEHPALGDRAWRTALAVGRFALSPLFNRRMQPTAPDG